MQQRVYKKVKKGRRNDGKDDFPEPNYDLVKKGEKIKKDISSLLKNINAAIVENSIKA